MYGESIGTASHVFDRSIEHVRKYAARRTQGVVDPQASPRRPGPRTTATRDTRPTRAQPPRRPPDPEGGRPTLARRGIRVWQVGRADGCDPCGEFGVVSDGGRQQPGELPYVACEFSDIRACGRQFDR